MKVITFILATYIFALNLVPCADGVLPSDEVKTELSQAHNHHDHDHQEPDKCSPFCHCNCCNHIQIVHFNVNYNNYFTVTDISTKDTFYICGTEKQYNTTLLQPPQV
ncbi:MAG: DUF6660 family protein [Aestuariibaculum sp.]